uniref:Uncharacterized protein n=1 Tax=Setaria digitata TaxID=48799 RepID=A0A915Q1W5_9BILA
MAQLYSGYAMFPSPAVGAQQQHVPQVGSVVRCPVCASYFYLSFPAHANDSPTAFFYQQSWPSRNVAYSQRPDFQCIQPSGHYRSSQNGMRPTFYPPALSNSYLLNVNQQQLEITGNTRSWQNASKHPLNIDNVIISQIRDMLVVILNSDMYQYGVAISELMILLEQSCTNCNLILPSSVIDHFKEFLRYEMADYVEVQDDLCRYRQPIVSIQEESIQSSSDSGKVTDQSKISTAVMMKREALLSYDRTLAAARTSDDVSVDQVKKVILEKELKDSQLSDKIEEHRRTASVNRTTMNNSVVHGEGEKCHLLSRHSDNKATLGNLRVENELANLMEKWKGIFVGDMKELIRYLRMVDDYFQATDGRFTFSKLKEVFGELNQRWDFCDIDLIEMGIVNVVNGSGLNEGPVFTVNPIIREIGFCEIDELAKKIYILLSKMEFTPSVKVEVIVRTLNFGDNKRTTIDENYELLWEVLSDARFQNVFIVDVLQKQNEECGFDVMVGLNPYSNLPGI